MSEKGFKHALTCPRSSCTTAEKQGWAHRESIKTQCFTSMKSSLPQSGIHNITRSEKLV